MNRFDFLKMGFPSVLVEFQPRNFNPGCFDLVLTFQSRKKVFFFLYVKVLPANILYERDVYQTWDGHIEAIQE